jgi:hypothetical protein
VEERHTGCRVRASDELCGTPLSWGRRIRVELGLCARAREVGVKIGDVCVWYGSVDEEGGSA